MAKSSKAAAPKKMTAPVKLGKGSKAKGKGNGATAGNTPEQAAGDNPYPSQCVAYDGE